MDVKIVEFPPTRVAMLTHLGHPDKVNASAAKFIAWRRETGQSPIASSQTLVLLARPADDAAGSIPL